MDGGGKATGITRSPPGRIPARQRRPAGSGERDRRLAQPFEADADPRRRLDPHRLDHAAQHHELAGPQRSHEVGAVVGDLVSAAIAAVVSGDDEATTRRR